jgi:hypothetical protein
MLLIVMLSACASPVNQTQSVKTCPDIKSVVEAFYAANDASQFATSMQYLTDDISLVTWAEGANGYHVSAHFAVGKNQILAFLGKPGLKRTSSGQNLPNFTMQEIQIAPSKMTFKLMADRLHPNSTRPYNHYLVEVFFSGCKIEVLKVVERVIWL